MAIGRSSAWAILLLFFSLSSAVIVKKDVMSAAEYPPLIMMAHGCSGTTGVFYTMRRLLKHLNFTDVARIGGGELLSDVNRSNTQDEFKDALWSSLDWKTWKALGESHGLQEKIKILHDRAGQDHQSILSKLQLDLAEANPDAMQYLLHDLNAKSFVLRRRNLLDTLACSIQDFCDRQRVQDYGHNVDQEGNEVQCEFRGRLGEENQASRERDFPSIVVDTSKLKTNLQNLEYENIRQEDYLKNDQGFANAKTFDAEDLFAFEYNQDDLHSSSVLWQELLSELGHETTIDAVENVLKDVPSFPPPKKHWEVFFNAKDVTEALKGSRYFDQLRM